ncbi:hypothetical protein H2204_008344 [Knufia peltigerae]|uniref:Asl1-like glycosyl hydrolase catalytic domain-containing protein n=1 Tax=Knufia peltigerae TaxID=1002370 RepID=A0AA38XZZ2_9EURO|nr:hypothetical protein H2204_008344 [Knufia peltigerae]
MDVIYEFADRTWGKQFGFSTPNLTTASSTYSTQSSSPRTTVLPPPTSSPFIITVSVAGRRLQSRGNEYVTITNNFAYLSADQDVAVVFQLTPNGFLVGEGGYLGTGASAGVQPLQNTSVPDGESRWSFQGGLLVYGDSTFYTLPTGQLVVAFGDSVPPSEAGGISMTPDFVDVPVSSTISSPSPTSSFVSNRNTEAPTSTTLFSTMKTTETSSELPHGESSAINPSSTSTSPNAGLTSSVSTNIKSTSELALDIDTRWNRHYNRYEFSAIFISLLELDICNRYFCNYQHINFDVFGSPVLAPYQVLCGDHSAIEFNILRLSCSQRVEHKYHLCIKFNIHEYSHFVHIFGSTTGIPIHKPDHNITQPLDFIHDFLEHAFESLIFLRFVSCYFEHHSIRITILNIYSCRHIPDYHDNDNRGSDIAPTSTWSTLFRTSTSSVSSATPSSSPYPSKRGLAYTNVTTLQFYPPPAPYISWSYNYYSLPNASDDIGLYPSARFRYIPLLYNDASSLTSVWPGNVNYSISHYGSDAIFGFNEPDACFSGQSACMNLTSVLSGYQRFMQPFAGRGVKIGAPAITNTGAPGGLYYLGQFLGNVTALNLTVDFINLHWYASPYNIEYFMDYITMAYNTTGGGRYPVWVTEFGMDNGNYDQSVVVEFMKNATNWMDQQPWIERYAWFGNFPSANGVTDMLLNADGSARGPLGNVWYTYNGTG